MIPARQSTALELSIGPVLDADGVAVTDCVVGDFKLKKTTGNFAALNGSATLTHVSAGTYDLVLTTSDTDTVGLLTVAIDDTTNACAPVRMQVIEEAVYDALFAASAAGYGTAQTGDSFARLGAPAGASVSADIAAVLARTPSATSITNLNTVFATDFATNYDATNDVWKANVTHLGGSAITADAITNWHALFHNDSAEATLTLDTIADITSLRQFVALLARKDAAAAADLSSALGWINQNWGSGAGAYDNTTDSQQAIRDNMGTAQTGDAYAIVNSGTHGNAALRTLLLDVPTVAEFEARTIVAASYSTHSAADVWAVATRVLTAGTNIVLAKGVGVTGFTDIDAAGIRTAVGLASANLDTQLDALPTAAENATAVLTTQMTESYRTNGAAPTLAQACCETLAHLGEASTSGTTTKTLKKFNHSTVAATYTLDDAEDPTSITRAG